MHWCVNRILMVRALVPGFTFPYCPDSRMCSVPRISCLPEVPKQFASRCMRKDLTDRKTVLYFNKRGTGPAFDVIKVDEVRSAHGGHLPSVELPCENKHHTVTAQSGDDRGGTCCQSRPYQEGTTHDVFRLSTRRDT